MSTPDAKDWSPETYGMFRGHRLRPAQDLMAQVPALPDGDIVDLGCGSGSAAADLRARFTASGACKLIGVDRSPAMLEKARELDLYDRLDAADISLWAPHAPPALVFSNAACQWLPDHDTLFAQLSGFLAPGGTLAVQMPRQFSAPSHALLRSIAEKMFPDRFDFAGWHPPVRRPVEYLSLLEPLGAAQVWETQYLQRLDPAEDGHPVRAFTQSTALRPFLEEIDEDEAAMFVAAYDQALAAAYPVDESGAAVMPFRRLFFVLTVGG